MSRRQNGETAALPPLPCRDRLSLVVRKVSKKLAPAGMSACVAKPGFAPWCGSANLPGQDGPAAAAAEPRFLIASIAKNYMAALTLKFAAQGLLNLDDSLGKWLPSQHPMIDPGITVHQLLNHTSGLADYVSHPDSPYRQGYARIEHDRMWSSSEILADMAPRPIARPGETWVYSTTNYLLLRDILEAATGTPLHRAMRRHLLDPLDLADTIVIGDAASLVRDELNVAKNWLDVDADGVVEDLSRDSLAWLSFVPHVMFATARDLAAWSQALLAERAVLGDTSLDMMLDAYAPIRSAEDPLIVGYGLGVAEFPERLFDGKRTVGHLGWDFGWMGALVHVIEDDLTIVVLMNTNDERAMTEAVLGLWTEAKEVSLNEA